MKKQQSNTIATTTEQLNAAIVKVNEAKATIESTKVRKAQLQLDLANGELPTHEQVTEMAHLDATLTAYNAALLTLEASKSATEDALKAAHTEQQKEIQRAAHEQVNARREDLNAAIADLIAPAAAFIAAKITGGANYSQSREIEKIDAIFASYNLKTTLRAAVRKERQELGDAWA